MKGLMMDIKEASEDAQIIEKLSCDTGIQIQLVLVSGLEQAKQIIGNEYPDFVFIILDSQFNFGLKITRFLAANFSRVKVIWLSQKKEYALMAFEENAWHFLKMPLDEESLFSLKKRLLSA